MGINLIILDWKLDEIENDECLSICHAVMFGCSMIFICWFLLEVAFCLEDHKNILKHGIIATARSVQMECLKYLIPNFQVVTFCKLITLSVAQDIGSARD